MEETQTKKIILTYDDENNIQIDIGEGEPAQHINILAATLNTVLHNACRSDEALMLNYVLNIAQFLRTPVNFDPDEKNNEQAEITEDVQ